MKVAGLKTRGYRRLRSHRGEVSIVMLNKLQRQFDLTVPDRCWMTDITYIRTHEDCFGWLMQAKMTKAVVQTR